MRSGDPHDQAPRLSRSRAPARLARRHLQRAARATAAASLLIGGCSVLASTLLAGCDLGRSTNEAAPDAPARGAQLIRTYGCGACHHIPHIAGANGNVGPSLERIADRVYLAGVLPNSEANLALWIREPQAIAQTTAMPDMGVSADEAAAMAAYFYRRTQAR